MTSIITSLNEKRRKKQWAFERKLLKQLTLTNIGNISEAFFQPLFPNLRYENSFLQDASIDLAIDAYLLGAKYSKFGYYGETLTQVQDRSYEEIQILIEELFDFLYGWIEDNNLYGDNLRDTVGAYILHWWEKGFEEGMKRYLLRLH